MTPLLLLLCSHSLAATRYPIQGSSCVVEDPLEPTENIARGSFRFAEVRAAFRDAHAALSAPRSAGDRIGLDMSLESKSGGVSSLLSLLIEPASMGLSRTEWNWGEGDQNDVSAGAGAGAMAGPMGANVGGANGAGSPGGPSAAAEITAVSRLFSPAAGAALSALRAREAMALRTMRHMGATPQQQWAAEQQQQGKEQEQQQAQTKEKKGKEMGKKKGRGAEKEPAGVSGAVAADVISSGSASTFGADLSRLAVLLGDPVVAALFRASVPRVASSQSLALSRTVGPLAAQLCGGGVGASAGMAMAHPLHSMEAALSLSLALGPYISTFAARAEAAAKAEASRDGPAPPGALSHLPPAEVSSYREKEITTFVVGVARALARTRPAAEAARQKINAIGSGDRRNDYGPSSRGGGGGSGGGRGGSHDFASAMAAAEAADGGDSGLFYLHLRSIVAFHCQQQHLLLARRHKAFRAMQAEAAAYGFTAHYHGAAAAAAAAAGWLSHSHGSRPGLGAGFIQAHGHRRQSGNSGGGGGR